MLSYTLCSKDGVCKLLSYVQMYTFVIYVWVFIHSARATPSQMGALRKIFKWGPASSEVKPLPVDFHKHKVQQKYNSESWNKGEKHF